MLSFYIFLLSFFQVQSPQSPALEGQILNYKQQAVQAAELHLEKANILLQSDAQGFFRIPIEQVAKGERLRISALGYHSLFIEVQEPKKLGSLQLSAKRKLRGLIRNPKGNEPIVGKPLYIEAATAENAQKVKTQDGFFELEIPEGCSSIKIYGPWHEERELPLGKSNFLLLDLFSLEQLFVENREAWQKTMQSRYPLLDTEEIGSPSDLRNVLDELLAGQESERPRKRAKSSPLFPPDMPLADAEPLPAGQALIAPCRFWACNEQTFSLFARKELQYPEDAKKEAVEGVVVLGFYLARDGGIEHAHIVQSLSPSCDAEALRLLQAFTKRFPWKATEEPLYLSIALNVSLDQNKKELFAEQVFQLRVL